jgi:hypothetical protein
MKLLKYVVSGAMVFTAVNVYAKDNEKGFDPFDRILDNAAAQIFEINPRIQEMERIQTNIKALQSNIEKNDTELVQTHTKMTLLLGKEYDHSVKEWNAKNNFITFRNKILGAMSTRYGAENTAKLWDGMRNITSNASQSEADAGQLGINKELQKAGAHTPGAGQCSVNTTDLNTYFTIQDELNSLTYEGQVIASQKTKFAHKVILLQKANEAYSMRIAALTQELSVVSGQLNSLA